MTPITSWIKAKEALRVGDRITVQITSIQVYGAHARPCEEGMTEVVCLFHLPEIASGWAPQKGQTVEARILDFAEQSREIYLTTKPIIR